MKNLLDKLQQAWQSQCRKPPAINPDQLLKMARLERRMIFWSDLFVVSVLVCVGMGMLLWALRNIHRDWPWLIYTATDAWVVTFIFFNQWRRRHNAARYDEPLLGHVEWSIKHIEHRMWQDRFSFWWYVLPLALGCMIPPVLLFAMEHPTRPLIERLIPLLVAEGVFAAVFTSVHLAMKYGQRKSHQGSRQELQALR